MDPEKQKQIMGYFIEEAKDHLTTIENGLLNLRNMLADSEMVKEVFRAAHSIKGGAAMLGITSVQHTAHNLEDYFKMLQENPSIPVDDGLQTLFLQGFDRLQELLEQIQSPYGLTQESADAIMAEADPIFKQLKADLNSRQASSKPNIPPPPLPLKPPAAIPTPAAKASDDDRAMMLVFQSDIPTKLRDMLQLFKQPDRPTSRQNLQAICDQLYQAGEQFELKRWCEMVRAVKAVVGSQNNSYRVLAPTVIKEIKQAQELVLAQKAAMISISTQLRELMPTDMGSKSAPADDDISSIFGAVIAENKVSQGWCQFGDQVGWRRNGGWLRTNDLNFSDTAPAGSFPAPIWLSAWDKVKDSEAEELRAQVAAFVSKLSECNFS